MDDTSGLLLRGIVLGLSIAAPVGPIGVLCIRRTLSEGRALGFASGLGAATADALYGCLAAFGLTFVSTFLISNVFWLRLIGGLFLCYLGLRTIVARPTAPAAASSGARRTAGLGGAYATTLALTLTNPMTVLSFVAIFAGLGLSAGSYSAAGMLVLGVFLGSALWWLLLSGGVSLLRRHLSVSGLRWINRLSGLVVLSFGALALLSIL
jgi:threonine/homoserine/homoserine lactone efflux protein